MVAGLVAALVLQLALALTLADHPLLQPVGDLDAGEYWRLAQRVAAGDVLLRGTPFYVSPLYIYWLAFAQVVTDASVTGVLVLQAVLGTIAVWLVALTARDWVPSDRRRVAGLAAGGALALTGIVSLQNALILQSALDAVLMAAFAYAFTRAVQVTSPPAWLACGAALALLATNRPNAWVMGVALVAAVWSDADASQRDETHVRAGAPRRGKSWRGAIARAGVLAAGALIVLAPFTLRTVVATGEWQLLPGHGGLNLYIGNHAGATGTYSVIDGIRPSMEGQREDARRVAEGGVGHALTDSGVSSHFAGRALAWWRDAPVDALRLFAYKAWLSTHAWELPVNVSYAWFRAHVTLLGLLPIGAWVLVPLGLAVVVCGHRLVSDDMQHAWSSFRLLLPAYLLSVAVFFVVDRYRAPALVLAAIGVGVLASARRATWTGIVRSPSVIAAALVAIVTMSAGFVRLPFHLGEADADTNMALHAIEAGRDDEARGWLSRAAAHHPTPGVAWLRAGLAWQSSNRMIDAERALREAYRLDPDVGDVAFALGEVLLAQGKGGEAVPLLEQAEAAGVRRDRARLDLALALWQAGQQDRARAALDERVPVEGLPLLRARALASVEARQTDLAEWLLAEYRRAAPEDAEVAEKLGLMHARRGDLAGAALLLEDAARLEPSRATARFNLAIVRVRQQRRDEAIALLRDALRIDPSYAQAAGALQELGVH